MNLVVRENVSITLRREACAWIVKKSASSSITTFKGLILATDEKPVTLSLIVSIRKINNFGYRFEITVLK